jgi:hypothetical protein
MGLLSYLRGDDLLEQRTAPSEGEQRSLPRPDNELPPAGLPTVWSGPTRRSLRPVEALAIRMLPAMDPMDLQTQLDVLYNDLDNVQGRLQDNGAIGRVFNALLGEASSSTGTIRWSVRSSRSASPRAVRLPSAPRRSALWWASSSQSFASVS